MSSQPNNKIRRDRLCVRNEKFSRLLRKKPRREMSPYRACYLRSIKVKESRRNAFQSPQQGFSMKIKFESLFSEKKRSQSEGKKHPLLTYSLPSSRDSKFITKKILCHKLKKQYQHKCQKIKQDIAKRIELLKSISTQNKNDIKNITRKANRNFLKTFKSDLIKKRVKCRSISKKLPYLSLNENIPKLELEKIMENDLEIEDNGIMDRNQIFVLSFPKKTVNHDLSKRPMLAMLKKMNKRGRKNI